MLRISYRNPLTKTYQYEYAMLLVIDRLFRSTSSRSMCIETLRLYYSELVKTNDNGNLSYARQIEMEEECEKIIKRDFIDKIKIGSLAETDAVISVKQTKDGSHIFIYDCGVGRRFAIKMSRRYPKRISVKDMSIRTVKRGTRKQSDSAA